MDELPERRILPLPAPKNKGKGKAKPEVLLVARRHPIPTVSVRASDLSSDGEPRPLAGTKRSRGSSSKAPASKAGPSKKPRTTRHRPTDESQKSFDDLQKISLTLLEKLGSRFPIVCGF